MPKLKWIKMTYSPLKRRQGNWTELTFAKTSGTVTKDREKIGQQLSSTSPVTIPESIGQPISAPVAFSFLKWRTIISQPMWRTIISHPMWRTIISQPMLGHPRRSWNSGFVFYAVDSAFHLLDSGFLSVALVELRIPIVSDAGFRIP